MQILYSLFFLTLKLIIIITFIVNELNILMLIAEIEEIFKLIETSVFIYLERKQNYCLYFYE